MQQRLIKEFGITGVELSTIGLGGHTFLPRYGGLDRADREELKKIVSTSVDKGINLFDVTYDEERKVFGSLAKELGIRQHIFLTCWMPKERTRTADDVKTEVYRALEMLDVDYVDMFYLDCTYSPEQVEAMKTLKKEGVMRFIGMLGADTALSNPMTDFDAVLVNHNYYIREKEDDIIRIEQQHPHLGIISLEPIGRGRFALDKAPPGISMAAACLKYALAFPPAVSTLIAVRRISELMENIDIWKGVKPLTEGELEALNAGRGYAIPQPKVILES